ncbi:MAG: NTP transferase domain-containing protein [Candidatus Delongbacteria bacterium]|nr:NTP transferase domain-containing protein [Candidatus Delongbacteria bacterium]MBN2834237.1 NTP transferase domain-containing protein [Candidatus Delongbacteria bacterium]
MFVVIMAGGVGSRFWPRSRVSSPKHLLNIVNEKSMLQNTIERAKNLTSLDRIFVVTSVNQKEMILKNTDLKESNVIAEPIGKNTSAAIALSAIILKTIDTNEKMIVLPADHYIRNVDKFCDITREALDYIDINEKALVTIGIDPTHPETGYGYIQLSEEKIGNVHKVLNFAEKPNFQTAVRFLESGDFIWNSGIFVWKIETILNAIRKHIPDLYEGLMEISNSINDDSFEQVLERVYGEIRSISIDYGVMEKSQSVFVLRGDFGWSDVGSWFELHRFKEKNLLNNVEDSKFIAIDSHNCYVYSDKKDKLITAIGLDDYAIVDTEDALLVTKLSRSQDVKDLVDSIKAKGLKKYL